MRTATSADGACMEQTFFLAMNTILKQVFFVLLNLIGINALLDTLIEAE